MSDSPLALQAAFVLMILAVAGLLALIVLRVVWTMVEAVPH